MVPAPGRSYTTPVPSGQHQTPQRLSLVERATARWIAGATRRHPATLVFMTAAIVLGDLLGANVDLRAYGVMGVWLGVALVEGPWCARAPDFAERRRRYAVALAVDAVMLGAAYYYIDAARILGISAFLLVVVSAQVVLPMRLAQAMAVLVLGVYAALLLVAVRTPDPVASPVGLLPLTGREAYLTAAVLGAAAIVFLVRRMQTHVLRTVVDAEARHQAVVNSAADMILVVDEQGRVVEANDAVLAYSGYSWEELRTLPNAALFPAEEWDEVLAAFRAARAGAVLERTIRVLTKDGRVLVTEATLAPLTVDEGPAVVVVARDVTERNQADERLREQDARLGLVLEALNSGFYTVDADLCFTSVRGRGAERAGALIGKSVAVIARSSEDAVTQREQHQKALAGNVVTWVWPVGGGQWIRSHVAPIRNAAGEVTGAAGFWRDETVVMHAREEDDRRWARVRAAPEEPS